ncbi:MAG: hypothetical protein HDR39_00395 [Treponema sp.]|nr:hypothetical protein [Treponema sp.]
MPVITALNFAAAMKDAKFKMIDASKNTVNIVAAMARKNAQQNISSQFTNRNAFTVNSVRYTQSKKSARKLADIKSETGITERAGYMARQETGGTKKSPSGSNLIIPNTRARGGSNANKVRPKYHYDEVIKNTVSWRPNGSKESRLVATAFVAAREKKFMRMNNAFFTVSNFRKTKSGVKFRMKEILNLKHKTTETPENKWLEPASEDAAKEMQAIFNAQMDKA